MANVTLYIQSANNANTVTLLATPVWKDGNPQEMKMWSKQILFSVIESMIILNNWIMIQTSNTRKIGGIFSGK